MTICISSVRVESRVCENLCLANCYFANDIKELMVDASGDQYYSKNV